MITLPGHNPFAPNPIVQLGYSVPDIDAAIERWRSAFNVGPIFVNREIRVQGIYRGAASVFYNTSAFIQWGNMQIELTQQLDDAPSMLRDVCPPGETRVISYAWFADEWASEVHQLNGQGFETVFTAAVPAIGVQVAFVDTRAAIGVLAEVHQNSEFLRNQYRKIAHAAASWDGTRPVRELKELSAL